MHAGRTITEVALTYITVEIQNDSMARGAALLAAAVNMNVCSLQVMINPTLRGEK